MAKVAKSTKVTASETPTNPTPRAGGERKTNRLSHFVQNLFSLLLLSRFIATSNVKEEADLFADEINSLTAKIMTFEPLSAQVVKSGHFIINPDGTIGVSASGQSLAIHRSSAMQTDKYRTDAVEYLFASRNYPERVGRSNDELIAIWNTLSLAFMNDMANQALAGDLTNDQRSSIAAAYNAFQPILADLMNSEAEA